MCITLCVCVCVCVCVRMHTRASAGEVAREVYYNQELYTYNKQGPTV